MEVLTIFLKLGLTSSGDPVAYIGYFRRESVGRRRWLNDATFTDLVGLCRFLSGPANSQVGFSVGLLRAGWRGGLAAWYDFTLSSALLLLASAVLTPSLGGPFGAGLIHGLRLAAVAVMAQAVWDMAHELCPDWQRADTAVLSVAIFGTLTTAYAQLIVITLNAALDLMLYRTSLSASGSQRARQGATFSVSHVVGIVSLALLCAPLFGLPALTDPHPWMPAEVFDTSYRSGILVFRGGHVILPLLEQQTVATGWVVLNDFLAGYGATQAVPGPLFTFATFLGWTIGPRPSHWAGAALATVDIFLSG